jgi:hypothetical protein
MDEVLQGIRQREGSRKVNRQGWFLLLTVHKEHRLSLRMRNVKTLPEREAVGGRAGSLELVTLLEEES